MNKIFKVIWNHATQSFVVVSELTKSKTKSSSTTDERSKPTMGNNLLNLGVGSATIGILGSILVANAHAAVAMSSTSTTYAATATSAETNSYAAGTSVNVLTGGSALFGMNSQIGNANRSAINAVAVAVNSTINGARSASLGFNMTVSGVESVAVGTNATVKGGQAVGIGFGANATGEQSTAIGNDVRAEGYASVAIGSDDIDGAKTTTTNLNGKNMSVAAGYKVVTNSTLIQTDTAGKTTLYRPAKASGVAAVAIGGYAQSEGHLATAIGTNTTASGFASMAVGVGAAAIQTSALAMGTGSKANAINSAAIGTNATATSNISLAIGADSIASDDFSVALGQASKARAKYANALGSTSLADKDYATAVGTGATADGVSSFSAGHLSLAFGLNSTAIGTFSTANATNSIAVGVGSLVEAGIDSGVAIGTAANASVKDSVALGSNTTTTKAVATNTATVNKLTYSGFAGNNPASVVSVGSAKEKRQIQNVAAGQISATSTDAINGSQLYATQQVLGNVADSIKTVLGGNAAVAPTGTISMSGIGNTGKNTVHDAIAAVKETVVKGKNTAVTSTVAENGSTTYKIDAVDTSASASAGSKALTVNNNGTKSAGDADVTDYVIDLSDETKANITHGVNANNTVTTKGLTFTADNGQKTLRKLGEELAVNGDNDLVKTEASEGKIKIAATDKLTNAVQNATTALQSFVTTVDTDKTAQTITKDANKANFITGDNIQLTASNQGITIATKKDVTFDNVSTKNFTATGDTKLNNVTVAPNAKVDMGGNRITNVGKPTEANDAATKQYVDSGRTKVTSKDKSVTINPSKDGDADVYDLTVTANLNYTGDNNTQGTNKLSEKVKFAGTENEIVTTAKDGEVKFKLADKVTNDIKTNAENIAKGFGLQAEDNNNVKKQLGEVVPVVGANSNIKTLVENDKVKIALNNTLNLTDAGSVKLGDTTVNKDGVTITGGPSVTKSGIHAGDKKITNVSDGVAPNDAVNVGQLNKVNATANAGWKLTVNKQDANVSTVKPNATVSLNNNDNNIVISKSANDNNVTFGLNTTLKVGTAKPVTIDGTNGTVGGLTNTKFDPNNIVTGQAATEDQLKQVHGDLNNNITNLGNALTTKGLNFVGDNTDVKIHRDLGTTLSVVGGANKDQLTDKNIGVIGAANGELVIKLAKTLSNLTSATFNNENGAGNTTIGGNGVTITPAEAGKSPVSLTNTGLNNGGNKITNVAKGTDDTDAVNVSQLKDVNATANAGWNLTINEGKDSSNVAPKATVDLANKDGNILITKDKTNVTFALNNDLTIGGKDGVNGANGKDGKIDVKGADGQTGVTLNGKDGSIGLTGPAGQDGKPGASTNISVANGKPGVDGKDGGSKTRIVYDTKDENGNPVKEEVATLNDGLKFGANDVTEGVRKAKLNEQVDVKGATTNSDWKKFDEGQNVMTKVIDGNITIAIAKDLQGLNSITFTNGGTGKDVVLNGNGLNNGGNKITNVSDGVDPNDAVNVSQLNKVNATANAGWNIAANGNNQTNVKPNANVSLNNEDGNILITKSADNNNVTFALNSTLSVGGLGKDGQPGKDGVIGAKGADGKTGVTLNGKDGSIGINGKDGSNGTITLAKGKPGVNGKDGDTKTRITYQPVDEKGNPKGDPEHVATLNDGLKFVGDTGEVIKKELNDTLTIKGNLSKGAEVTDKNLRVDNVNGALILKMAKSLQELTNATFVDNAGNRSVIDGNGLTITPKADSGKAPVSLTDKGLNNGGNQVTNVSSGLVDNKGQKVDLANATGDVLNNAVNVGDLKNSINNLTNATTGGFGLTGDDGKSAKADLGKTVTVQGDGSVVTKVVKGKDGKDALQVGLSNDVTIGNGKEPGKVTVKGENGKDGVVLNGKDGSAEFKNADGKTTVAINGKDGTIGLNGKDGVATKVDGNGVTITGGANGTVNLTDKGLNNGGNTITNVAAGVNATDAVNVSQLKDATAAATSKVEAGKNTVVTPTKNADGSTTYTVATKDEVDFTKVATGNTTMTNEGVKIGDLISLTENGLNNGGKKATNIADGDISATSKDAVNGSQLHATNQNVTNLQNTVAKGWNIEADTVDGSTGKVIGKSKAKVAMGDTVAVKAGNNIEITQEGKNIAIATSANPNFDSVKIGKGSNTAIISTTEDGAINVANANGGPTRITNVAAGKKDNDAVNVAQLKGAMSNINNNINAVNNKVDKVDRDLRAGIAGAMAAGNLYHVTIPGKSMVSAGIGTYKNQGAVAVGYSRLSDNGKIGVKFSVNTNTRGDSGAAASVGYQW